jgi:hypothetical protein
MSSLFFLTYASYVLRYLLGQDALLARQNAPMQVTVGGFLMSHTEVTMPSMRTQIRELPAGESYTRCRRVPLKWLARHDLSQEVDNLRNSVNSAMYRASADTGQEYILDNIQVVPPSRDSIMLLAVVTRTA